MSFDSQVEDLVKQIYGMAAVRRRLAAELPSALGRQGFAVLIAVYSKGPARVSEIAEHLCVDLSVASRQLQVLAEAGYLSREPDPEDGRAHLLSLTDDGLAMLRDAHKRLVAASAKALADWDEQELTDLAGGLAGLRATFLDLPEPVEMTPDPAEAVFTPGATR